jgi:peptide/nickel transport system substrate-binding protein
MEELRQVGITVNLEVVQHAAMHELIRQDRNAIVFYNTFRPTADFYLTHFYSSESGVVNFPNFMVDELRDEARVETDPDRQIEIWKQAMIEIQSNYAATGLLYYNNVYAHSSRVDYGHEVSQCIQLYPNFTELTSMSSD